VPFLCAVILAAAGTVLLASRLGLPISTTHALVGSLVGAGVSAAGLANVHFSALGHGVLLPLLFSPVAALLVALTVYPLVQKLSASRDCVCVDKAVRWRPLHLEAQTVPSASTSLRHRISAGQTQPSVKRVRKWFALTLVTDCTGFPAPRLASPAA
jgi:phosphate/sulfate permease